MKRLFILFAAVLFAAVACNGPKTLPNDSEVRVGKLENGMTYYIRHNEQPAERAEFYLATDVGAFQEEDHQDGLAHFLEHMCFNGTKNFPGKSLLEWLQSIGAEFGRNINASTGFEQTQYMLNNIPVTRETIVDSCLLILHDYSHFVTNDPAEIDAERGVILEEKRTRSNASWRIFEKSLPYYYGDTPYARRTLIGGEEQLKTFAYESLTSFYQTWCRPDLQAVIVVGDVDVDQVEQKIKEIFADIPAAENPKEKVLHKIPDNAEPIVGVLTDPELTSSSIEVMWKSEPLPKEEKNTMKSFELDLMRYYIRLIMRERFDDITADPNAPFLGASLYVSSLCNSCDATMANVTFKEGQTLPAFASFMVEIEKMKRFGFTEAEVERATTNIISRYEKAAEAAPTRKNAEFVYPLLYNFYDNEPYMDPATELKYVKKVCSKVNAKTLSELAAGYITDDNMVIIYTGPEKKELVNPTVEELTTVLAAVKSAEIAANVEETVDGSLIKGKLTGSPVVEEAKGLYESTVWTLDNGIKVVVLPTQHKKDQVLFEIRKEGGKTLIANEDLPSFEDNIWALFLQNSGISEFSNTQVSKMLAGKNIAVNPFIGSRSHGISGQSTPKDLETALQIMYLYFADPRFDEAEYETGIQQIRAVLPNIAQNPDFMFQNAIQKIFYNSPRTVELNEQTLEKANLATIERVYRELFKDGAGATLRIVGNVNPAELKPMVEKYIGSIAKGDKAAGINKENLIGFVKGAVNETVALPMETPKSTVVHIYTAYMPIDTKTQVALEAGNYILDMIYTKTIREDEGGTYGVGTAMVGQRSPVEQAIIQVQFDTNPEMAARLSDLAKKGLRELAEKGPEQDKFNKAMENFKKNIPESRISNSYWSDNLHKYNEFGIDYDAEYEAAVNELTPADVQAAVQKVLAQNNLIEVTSTPAAK